MQGLSSTDPIFSIVTVVWNDPAGLLSTRRSLESQSFTKWHHIVIDGKSDQSSHDILNQIGGSAQTTLVSEPDEGIYDAMNKGIRFCIPGTYVLFLNAGDRFSDTNVLEDVYAHLRSEGYPNWFQGTHIEESADGSSQYCRLTNRPTIQNQLYVHGFRSHQATFMRLDLLESLGGFHDKYEIAADWDLMSRAHLICSPSFSTRSIAIFALGGYSSSRLEKAHEELREIRVRYLIRTPLHKVLDDIWMAVALHHLGFRNKYSPVLAFAFSLFDITGKGIKAFLLAYQRMKMRLARGMRKARTFSRAVFRLALRLVRGFLPEKIRAKIFRESTRIIAPVKKLFSLLRAKRRANRRQKTLGRNWYIIFQEALLKRLGVDSLYGKQMHD